MIKTICGIIMMIVGCLLTGMLLSSGKLIPHILGPIVLITAGVLLLTLKRKGKAS